MTESAKEPPDRQWQSNFSELIKTAANRADSRARSSSDPNVILKNMDLKTILMQYGTDLLHIVYQMSLDDLGRERVFEAISHCMLGLMMSGRLDGDQYTSEMKSEKPKGRTGPAPIKKDEITKRMLDALRSGESLIGEKQEVLTQRFGGGASRTTVAAAFRDVMSIWHSENSDKTLTNPDNL